MLNGDVARYRVHDMVRSAEGHRAGRPDRRRAQRSPRVDDPSRCRGDGRAAVRPAPALRLARGRGSLGTCGSTSSRSSRGSSTAVPDREPARQGGRGGAGRRARPRPARLDAATRIAASTTTSFGGGPGMVLKPEPLFAAVESLDPDRGRVLALSPAGRRLDQAPGRRAGFRAAPHVLCGRYEGFDERVIDGLPAEEVSIGDYVAVRRRAPRAGAHRGRDQAPPGRDRQRRIARARLVQRAGHARPPALHAPAGVPRHAGARTCSCRGTTRRSRRGARGAAAPRPRRNRPDLG